MKEESSSFLFFPALQNRIICSRFNYLDLNTQVKESIGSLHLGTSQGNYSVWFLDLRVDRAICLRCPLLDLRTYDYTRGGIKMQAVSIRGRRELVMHACMLTH